MAHVQQERFPEPARRAAETLVPLAHALSDAELLGKLEDSGVRIDRDILARLSGSAGSAEEIARDLIGLERLKRHATDTNVIWVWSAIEVLWERWFPDSPSFEMLNHRIRDGYDRPDRREGCEEWLEGWRFFQQLADRLQIRTLQAFEQRFKGVELLHNWVQDVEMTLGDLARPNQDREWFQRRMQFCQEFLSRFPNVDSSILGNMRRGLAESLAGVGENQRADELFRSWLEMNPRWGWGWIGWADCYLFAQLDWRDLSRAEQILHQGLAVDGVEDRDVLYERLQHVYEEQGRKDKAAEMGAALAKLKSPPAPIPVQRAGPKVGRNDPCPCGSGKKFKKCCGA